ncbi:MAG: HD-GYP domain-containing protein [Candidatus Cloacimonetes bacterium]|nr:HD-GYP domain-containing protein [Candidatus Cloacimonadota bacterium]
MIKNVPLKEVKIGMCLAESVYTKSSELIYRANFYFTAREQIIRLLDSGITAVKINLAQSLLSDTTSTRKDSSGTSLYEKVDNDYQIRIHEDPEKIYHEMTERIEETKELFDLGDKVISDLMNSARFGQALNHKSIRDQTTKIVKSIKENHLITLALLDLRKFDEYAFIHSINVAVLSVAFANNIKFSEDKLQLIAQGSILHDIGKAKVPIDILNKPGKLNSSELKIMQKHPVIGVQVVEEDHIDNEIIKEIIMHHHENYDGTGYPAKTGASNMKRYASIVSIADCYDALTTQRVYKDTIHPAEAMKRIFTLSGTKFDPRVVNHFIKTVGIYPVGSIVELSDNRVAKVISFTPDNLLQPIVKTLFNKNNPKIPNQEIISLVNSDKYITGICTDYIVGTYDMFKND